MISLVLSFLVLIICLLVLYQMSRGAAFVPSHAKTVAKMMELANLKPGMQLADLGSGDGRIVIAASLTGAQAVGFELNPLLALWSRFKIKKLGLERQAHIKIGDFWNADFSQFDVVTIFGINYIMKKLEKKLLTELKPGAIVISNAFEFPTWKKVKNEYGCNVYKK
jgi:protein-L-isoaspartate O-methyltransferase